MIECCAIHRHSMGVLSKLGAGLEMFMPHYIYQHVMLFFHQLIESETVSNCGGMVEGQLNRLNAGRAGGRIPEEIEETIMQFCPA